MARYRLYFLNPYSGHIDRFEEFAAAGDAEAIARAGRDRPAAPLELWCGHRKIHRFDRMPQLAPGTLSTPRAAGWRPTA